MKSFVRMRKSLSPASVNAVGASSRAGATSATKIATALRARAVMMPPRCLPIRPWPVNGGTCEHRRDRQHRCNLPSRRRARCRKTSRRKPSSCRAHQAGRLRRPGPTPEPRCTPLVRAPHRSPVGSQPNMGVSAADQHVVADHRAPSPTALSGRHDDALSRTTVISFPARV